MIVAAGLTPAWQQILVFDEVVSGEVNRARSAVSCASGKVLNVGRACHSLGGSTRIICPIGGVTGAAIEADFARDALSARWVPTAVGTRTCTTVIDARSGQVTELVENSTALSATDIEAFISAFVEEAAKADCVVLSGSLPPQCNTDFYARLIPETNGRVLLDARGAELVAALPHKPFLVKPNRSELEQTVGRCLDDESELILAMRHLNLAGAEWVLVTDGPGPLWLGSSARLLRFDPPPLERLVNPIGCGDCLAAGIAVGLHRGESLPDAVALGIAAAAVNAGEMLPARLDRNEVDRLRQQHQLLPAAP